jgi:cobalt-zinc-cadmium efflux system outer membrane protein
MSKRRISVFLVVSALLGGCAAIPEKGGFDQVQQQTSERIGQQVHWNQGSPEDEAVAQAVHAMLNSPLSAEQAMQIALLNNRDLQAAYEELGIAQAVLVQAGLLKNPRFSAAYLPAVGGETGAIVALDLSQDFVDLLFVGLRKSQASWEFEAAKARVTAAVLDKAAETRVAFFELQAAEQLLEMRKSVTDAAAYAQDVSNRLFEAGNISKLALANERANHIQAKLDLSLAQAAVLTRRERLNRLMGVWGPDAAVWKIAGRLTDIPKDEIDLQGIERRAVSSSLDLARARARVEATAKRAGFTKWSTILSDLEVGVGADREDDGIWHLGPTVSFQVPIFDQGQAKNAAVAGELRRDMQAYAATAVELRSAAREARDRLVMARDRALYCRDVLLPTRNEVLHESQLHYNGMVLGVFQLLMAKRDAVEAGTQYIESLRDYWIARAQLELIIAGRMSTVESDSRGISGSSASNSTRQGH